MRASSSSSGIIEHLTAEPARRPSTAGQYTYDADDDYPAFCIAAARRRRSPTRAASASCSADPATVSRWPRTRCPVCAVRSGGASRRRKLAREHNNAQVIGIGGQHAHPKTKCSRSSMHSLTTPWSKAERHQRRIDILAEYERTHVAPPVPPARRATGMPEGPHPAPAGAAASSAASGARRSWCPARRAVSPTGATAVNGHIFKRGPAPGVNICSTTTTGDSRGARAPRAVRHVHRVPIPPCSCPSVRYGCG